MTGTFNANYGGINKNVYLHVAGRLYQTLPLYSSLGTTGVYVYGQDFDVAQRRATIFAQTQVRNEYAVDKSVSYEVVIIDLDGRAIKTISGEPQTIKAGETRTLSLNARVGQLNFWSWGYGYLYRLTILKVDGQGGRSELAPDFARPSLQMESSNSMTTDPDQRLRPAHHE
jgi:beta-galactosidase